MDSANNDPEVARDEPETVLLIGAGHMGGAMLTRWLDMSDDNIRFAVYDPKPSAHIETLSARHAIPVNTALTGLSPIKLVILAVPPQIMAKIVKRYRDLLGSVPVLSVAAGWTLSNFEAEVGSGAAITRAMPNMPALIGRGVTVLCANQNVDASIREFCTALLSAVGSVHWVEDEALMDAVTAVSGSGPGYLFYVTECLANAGKQAGLPDQLAEQLARDTVAGVGELLYQSEESAETLRKNVALAGGTTEAGLSALFEQNALADVFGAAVRAATERSRALSAK